jgi:hypothetical protein
MYDMKVTPGEGQTAHRPDEEDRRMWPQIIHRHFLSLPELFDDFAKRQI